MRGDVLNVVFLRSMLFSSVQCCVPPFNVVLLRSMLCSSVQCCVPPSASKATEVSCATSALRPAEVTLCAINLNIKLGVEISASYAEASCTTSALRPAERSRSVP